jgi:hypothetical protein
MKTVATASFILLHMILFVSTHSLLFVDWDITSASRMGELGGGKCALT